MYVRLQLMGVLSASENLDDGELPGLPGVQVARLNLGDLWGGDLESLGRGKLEIDAGREILPAVSSGIQNIWGLGIAVDSGQLALTELMSNAHDVTIRGGALSDETRAAMREVGVDVAAPIFPAVRH
ncbi:MAG: hypothetical protein INF16_05530 [Methylobacterium sp.]|nr:hypothetical protein [Methylobacterium sp.]